jgi:hypothetical protein
MQDATLARRILEKLDDAFPRKLHLHELRALLPEHLVDAAALFITEQGRLYLHADILGRPAEASDLLPVFLCHSSGANPP